MQKTMAWVRKYHKANAAYNYAFLQGAQQALAWVARDSAMRPSACVRKTRRKR